MIHTISLLFTSTSSQQLPCTSGTNQVPFNACFKNNLYGPMTGTLFTTPETACSEIPSETLQYYQCICEKTGGIVFCYDSFCIGSDDVQVYISSRTSSCASAAALRASIASAAKLPPLITSASAFTSTTPKSSPTPMPKINGDEGEGLAKILLGMTLALLI